MGRRKSKSPSQSARSRLMKRHGLKGGKANIWITTCPRTGEEVVLLGDPRIEHFYACEGDPTVRSVSYNLEPMLVTVCELEVEVRFDAKVETVSGSIEYRIVCASAEQEELKLRSRNSAAAQNGGSYREVTNADLDALKLRINNWRRALRHLRACSHFPLGEIQAMILCRLRQSNRTTVAEILASLTLQDPALVLGAIIKLLHNRTLSANLDREIWCMHTVVESGVTSA